MSITSGRRYPNNAARRTIASPGVESRRPKHTPITIIGTHADNTSVITFDQSVILAGIPPWTNNAGSTPLTAVLTHPDELTLTYPILDNTTAITVPFESEGVRNGGGGYVLPGTFS